MGLAEERRRGTSGSRRPDGDRHQSRTGSDGPAAEVGQSHQQRRHGHQAEQARGLRRRTSRGPDTRSDVSTLGEYGGVETDVGVHGPVRLANRRPALTRHRVGLWGLRDHDGDEDHRDQERGTKTRPDSHGDQRNQGRDWTPACRVGPPIPPWPPPTPGRWLPVR